MAKVLIIGINYSPEPTGSAPYTAGIAEMLVESGHDVEALVGIPHYPWWKPMPFYKFRLRSKEIRNKVSVTHFRHFVPKKQTMIGRILWELTFFLNVFLSKPKSKPDIVICSSPSLSGGLLGVRFSRKYRTPLITFVQDVLGQAVTQSGLKVNATVGNLVSRLELKVVNLSSSVCIVSPSFKQYISSANLDDNRISIFPNWTHISSPTKSRNDARSLLGWRDDQVIVLHTGNMGLKQDLVNLVETAKLFENTNRFRYVLCGDGNQRRHLQSLSQNVPSISFMEPVPDAEYPNLLLAADMLVVNERESVGEMSLPSKLTSYLAIGRPIIAAVGFNGACAQELNKTGGAALILPSGDPERLASEIIKLSNDPEKMEQMSKKAQDYALTHLSRSSAKERIEKLVAKLLEA